MMRVWIGFATCFVLILTSATISLAEHKPDGDVGRGAKFYSDNCARCHNARPPMEHRNREWSIVMVHMRIIGRIPGAQARDIEAFLRASNTPPRPPLHAGPKAAERSGRELVGQSGCQGCHVIGGTGGTIGPDLDTVFERRDEVWVGAKIANPREHQPDSVMPTFGLSEEQINTIVEFLRKSQ